MTRPTLQRLGIRFQAARNIADALIHGWANILLDKLHGKRSESVNGKRQTIYKKRTSENVG